MNFPNTITLTLTKAHKKQAVTYFDHEKCLLGIALKEKPSFRDRKVWVAGTYVEISGRPYVIPNGADGRDPILALYEGFYKFPYSITLHRIP